MTIYHPYDKSLTIGETTFTCDKITFTRKDIFNNITTVSRGVYTRLGGSQPAEVCCTGRFAPSQTIIITELIESFVSGETAVTAAGIEMKKAMLIKAEAVIEDDNILGRFTFVFGRLTDDLYG